VGGGDSGLIEALYLAKFASRVHLIETAPSLSAAAPLQAQARGNERFDLRLEHRVVAVCGAEAVESIEIENLANGLREKLPVHGVLVHAGFLPCGEFLAAALELDDAGYVPADEGGVTQAEGIFVAGDVRAGASRRVAAAIEEGKRAAAVALEVINRK
jgi:thioredoxin reductase (NADPH)